MIIFDSIAIVKPADFARDLIPTPAPKAPARVKARVSNLDMAWRTGFTAGQEDGPDAMPPASFDDAERGAFFAGLDSATAGAWDDADLDAEQAMFEDAMACGFYHA